MINSETRKDIGWVGTGKGLLYLLRLLYGTDNGPRHVLAGSL